MCYSIFSFICFQVCIHDFIVTVKKESKMNCLATQDQIQCSQTFRFSVMHDVIIKIVLEQVLSNLAEFWKNNLPASPTLLFAGPSQ